MFEGKNMRQLKTSLLDRSANYLVNRFNNFFSSSDEDPVRLQQSKPLPKLTKAIISQRFSIAVNTASPVTLQIKPLSAAGGLTTISGIIKPLHHNFYQLKDHELTYIFSSKQISYIKFSQK